MTITLIRYIVFGLVGASIGFIGAGQGWNMRKLLVVNVIISVTLTLIWPA